MDGIGSAFPPRPEQTAIVLLLLQQPHALPLGADVALDASVHGAPCTSQFTPIDVHDRDPSTQGRHMESSLRAVCCVAKEPGIYIDRWPEDDYISTATHTTVNQIDRGLSDFIQGFAGPGGQSRSVRTLGSS